MKKTVLSYVIAIIAAIPALFAAFNIRECILLLYRAIRAGIGGLPLEGSFINAVSVILLMAAWVVYLFYTQYRFEKKCDTKEDYIKASYRLILPVVIIFAATQIFLSVISR